MIWANEHSFQFHKRDNCDENILWVAILSHRTIGPLFFDETVY